MPAKAGIQSVHELAQVLKPWIPAFAGMTPMNFDRLSHGFEILHRVK
jgi:hypothetical protein